MKIKPPQGCLDCCRRLGTGDWYFPGKHPTVGKSSCMYLIYTESHPDHKLHVWNVNVSSIQDCVNSWKMYACDNRFTAKLMKKPGNFILPYTYPIYRDNSTLVSFVERCPTFSRRNRSLWFGFGFHYVREISARSEKHCIRQIREQGRI